MRESIRGVNHLTLSQPDLAAAVDFYVSALGCELVAEWPAGAYLLAGDTWVALVLGTGATNDDADYSHIAFDVDPDHFTSIATRLHRDGTPEWQENWTEGDSLYFEDPGGHRLEIHCSTLATRLRTALADPWDGLRVMRPDLAAETAQDAGRVVVLNGTTSSGKTSLALELQSQLIATGECWMVFGIDDYLSHLPVEWLGYFDTGPHADEGIDFRRTGDEIAFQAGAVGRALLAAYRESIAALARNGLNVIVDEVVVEDEAWVGWTTALHGIDTSWVRVDCPLAVCEAREHERSDRLQGLARSQAPVVHRAVAYDMAVDTSTASPDALAATIVHALSLRVTNLPPP